MGSVEILIGFLGIVIGVLEIVIGFLEILIGQFRDFDCRDYDCRDLDIDPNYSMDHRLPYSALQLRGWQGLLQ